MLLLDMPNRNQKIPLYNTRDAPGPVLLPKTNNVITSLFWKDMSRINIPFSILLYLVYVL